MALKLARLGWLIKKPSGLSYRSTKPQNSIMIFALKLEMVYFYHGQCQRDPLLILSREGLQSRQKIIPLTISILKEPFPKATMVRVQLLYGIQAPIQRI